MKLSRKWLDEFVKIDSGNRDFSEDMTLSGSKVEGYETPGEAMSNVVVGRVTDITRNTNSDHMWICQVDVGRETVQIVTGAQNVKKGDFVFAIDTGKATFDVESEEDGTVLKCIGEEGDEVPV